jgi:VanZ family protein
MPLSEQPPSLQVNPQLLRRLLLCYWLFIVYASFIPFFFNLDPNFLRWRLDVLVSKSLYRALTRWSWSDIIGNILLYFPFGLLWLGSLRSGGWLARSSIAPLVIGTIGLCAGLIIEVGQTFSPYRNPSMLDAFCNGIGALMGATAGNFLFRAMRGSLGHGILWLAHNRPGRIVLGFLLLASVTDSYYPFHFVFDMPTLGSNLRRIYTTQLWPAFPSTWIDIIFDKGIIFVAIGYVIFRERQRASRGPSALRSWLSAGFAAVAIEAGKIFFVGPTFQLANICVRAFGALCGVTIIPALSCLEPIRRRPQAVLLAAMLAILCYFELWPFDWINAGELPAKIAQIEGLPLASYFFSMPQAALFDLANKLFLALPFGFLATAANPVRDADRRVRYTVLLAALISIVLEACQLAIRSRVPSVTDVLTITSGSWVGAATFEWFTSTRISNDPKGSHRKDEHRKQTDRDTSGRKGAEKKKYQ